MKQKISIIVPVHNVENYLEQCLTSIANQTIGLENLQVIMVDDHSTDNSLSIMNKYSEKHNNFISISLEEGKTGAGVARNEGLKNASSKYIMFTDSDDFYEFNACEIMYNVMEEAKTDFATFNYRNADEDGTPWENPIFKLDVYQNMKLDIKDYDKSFYVMNSSVCNKIFNREFLLKNNIWFFDDGKPSEDTYFSMSAFLNAVSQNGACYNQNIVYNYRQRNKSKTSLSNKLDYDFFINTNEANKEIYRLFKRFNQIEFYRYYFAKSMSYILYRFIDAKILRDTERIKILEEMRWFYKLSIDLNIPACQESMGILIDRIISRNYEAVLDMGKIIAEIREFVSNENKYRMTKPLPEMYKRIGETTPQNIPEI